VNEPVNEQVNEQLTDNDAMLLLYLADELPDGERKDIAQQLEANPGLAAQLAAMNSVHQHYCSSIALLDEVDRDRLTAERAISAAAASVQSWNFGPRKIATPVAPHRNRIWAWAAPISLAASVLVAALIWIEHRPANSAENEVAIHGPATLPKPTDDTAAANDSDTNLALLQRSFSPGFEPTARRTVPEFKLESTSHDDLSDYLLKTEVGPQ
jgi:hypothetical protein